MSPDIFPKYLEDPSLLYRVSYEELKTLVVQYPYCQNLRYLLLVKSKMEGNMDQDRNMKMASAYSLDRTQLYLLLKKEAVENQKELEFLDINHAVSDEEHQELELPVLDFSNGLEVKEKEKAQTIEFDLTQHTNSILNDEEDEDELEFPDEEDILIQQGYGVDDHANTDVIIQEEEEDDDLELSSVDPIDETIIAGIVAPLVINSEEEEEEEEEEVIEVETLAPVPSYSLPLVPPSIDLEFSEIEEAIKDEAISLSLPLELPPVPPSIDLKFPIVEEVVEAISEPIPLSLPLVPPSVDLNIIPSSIIAEDIIAVPLALPVIPPLIDITAFKIAIPQEIEDIIFTEEIDLDFEEEEEQSFAEEIDISIQAALKRLAKEQEKELEEEAAEEEAETFAFIKKEILEEGGIEEEPNIAPEEEPRPMPKASFSSWLGRMSAPRPSSQPIEEKSNALPVKARKKKKKDKKKKKKRDKNIAIIDTESSRLIRAIKARQKEQRKAKTKEMLVRKKKVMQFAEKSLKENEEIISETLAKILVIQGKKDKAEFMYRKLILKFPEKSSFFAAEIEKIQKLK